ncbi:M24 family metallopeptidase [Actinoplanes sp. NPDC051411]|uniref:M24 family metallopeptidase n=1 Tax=Actinoplanes sp. NPDC051411 TaxID=3155522 RepID=UPI00344801EA
MTTVADFVATRVVAAQRRLATVSADALLVAAPHHVRYLTGRRPAGELLLTGGDLLTEPDAIVERLGFPGTGLLAETRHLTAARLRELAPAHANVEDGEWLLTGLRRHKDALELELLRRATELTGKAVRELADDDLTGVAELDLECRLWRSIRAGGAQGWAFDPSLAGGARAARPWHGVTTRALERGDVLVADVGAEVHGYKADLTRTFVVGGGNPVAGRALDAVRRARDAALAALRPGVPAAEVARAVAASLSESGFAGRMPHAAGHGIGLELHEAPFLTLRSTDVLDPGTVVNVEPGVYDPAWGGARLEDTVVIRDDGWEPLGEVTDG